MPEQVKMRADATKLNEISLRKCEATSITSGSFVKTCTSHSGRHCANSVIASISTTLIFAATLKVSRTRA